MKLYNFRIAMVHNCPAWDIPYSDWWDHGIIRENSGLLEIVTTSEDFESPIIEEPIFLAAELDERIFRRWMNTAITMYGYFLPEIFSPRQLAYSLTVHWDFRWNYYDIMDKEARLKWYGDEKKAGNIKIHKM